jgi:hypothetical protein
MPFTGIVQEFETLIVQVEQLAPQSKRILCSKFPVVQLEGVILTAGVVKGGEEPNNINRGSVTGGNLQTTLLNPSPMSGTVDGIMIPTKFSNDLSPYSIEVDRRGDCHG